jgi:hypothetical protein
MKHTYRMTAAALVITAATALAGGAQAATLIDFTDRSVWSGVDGTATSSASYGGLTVGLTSNPANRLNFTQPFDSQGPAAYCLEKGGRLACDSDGVGVIDDEITNDDSEVTPPRQSITVTFSKVKRVLSFEFLDLFFAGDEEGPDHEVAMVYVNGNRDDTRSFSAVDRIVLDGGYKFVANPFGNLNINSLTFFADSTNDTLARPDYALAAISVAPVPLPAAGWLLLAGIGGLGALRRFRKT